MRVGDSATLIYQSAAWDHGEALFKGREKYHSYPHSYILPAGSITLEGNGFATLDPKTEHNRSVIFLH